MFPAQFDYARPTSLEEALDLYAANGDEAKLLAGGHSLLPLMKLRLVAPTLLIDLGRLRQLRYVRDNGDHVAIGALTRHRDLEIDPVLASHAPLLAHVAAQIGDPQVRHRGTIGGSVAHGDPASDLPATLLALGASYVVRGANGERVIEAADFHLGFLETALEEGEILSEIRVPYSTNHWSFQKFNLRAQDWAIVGAVAVRAETTAVGLINMSLVPIRAAGTEAALMNGASASEAAARADEDTEPSSDLHASSEFRRHLAQVLVRRALEAVGA